MNRILISIGPIDIYWYSFLILIAIILGVSIAQKEAPNRKISYTFLGDLIFGLVISAIIGARLYYVIFNFELYQNNLLGIFKIWEGGLAIYGAIIGGIAYLYYFCHQREQELVDVLDLLAPSLIRGQAIGRWGNFFNQEAYGLETSLEFLQKMHIPDFIINNMYIDGHYYTPTFLYESLWCFLGFCLLIFLRRRQRNKPGHQLATYTIWYGVGRYAIESLRTDSLYIGNYRVSQLVSLVFILFGLAYFIIGKQKKTRARKEEDSNVKINL